MITIQPFYNGEYDTQTDFSYEQNGANYWYLHGELEYAVRYDKGEIVNACECGMTKQQIRWSSISGNKVEDVLDGDLLRCTVHINGIIPVRVVGIDEPCIGFFRTKNEHLVEYNGEWYPVWEQHGFVVLESDSEGVKQVKDWYRNND